MCTDVEFNIPGIDVFFREASRCFSVSRCADIGRYTYVAREAGGGGFAGDYVQENVARGQERNVVTPGG